MGGSWYPSSTAFGAATASHGHTPASAPPIPFSLSLQASPYASTPPAGGGAPRALHFSTPRSRRHSTGADADVDALCAELDARVRSLQLARARDTSGALSPAATAPGGGPAAGAGSGVGAGAGAVGRARDPFSPEANHRYASGTLPGGAPLSSAPTDWAAARRQLSHTPVSSQVTPWQVTPSGDWRSYSHSNRSAWPGPYPGAYPDSQPKDTPLHSRFGSQAQALTPSNPLTGLDSQGSPVNYGPLATPNPGGLAPAPSPSPSRFNVSGISSFQSLHGTPGVYPSGQPFSYAQRTPLSYTSPFTSAPSSVPPAVFGSHHQYGASPSQLAGTPVTGHVAGLDWLSGGYSGSYPLSTRHPASAPPHLGAPRADLAPAGTDPGLTPPSLAGAAVSREAPSHLSGLPVAGTPVAGVPGGVPLGVPGGVPDLWGLRLLPSPSQVHSSGARAKKSAARAAAGGKVALVAMGPEEVRRVMGRLGVLPFLDSWRDVVRQWFASDLLATLVDKIRRLPAEVRKPSVLFSLLLF